MKVSNINQNSMPCTVYQTIVRTPEKPSFCNTQTSQISETLAFGSATI